MTARLAASMAPVVDADDPAARAFAALLAAQDDAADLPALDERLAPMAAAMAALLARELPTLVVGRAGGMRAEALSGTGEGGVWLATDGEDASLVAGMTPAAAQILRQIALGGPATTDGVVRVDDGLATGFARHILTAFLHGLSEASCRLLEPDAVAALVSTDARFGSATLAEDPAAMIVFGQVQAGRPERGHFGTGEVNAMRVALESGTWPVRIVARASQVALGDLAALEAGTVISLDGGAAVPVNGDINGRAMFAGVLAFDGAQMKLRIVPPLDDRGVAT